MLALSQMSNSPSILIVEDEAAIRDGLADVFVYHGFDVSVASDGVEGLEQAKTGRFDMLLLDVMLPGVNGFDICEQVRAHDPAQPIIMLTAKSADEDIINGLRLGADDYVAKPFSIAQLVLRVEAVLRRALPTLPQETQLTLATDLVIDTENLSAVTPSQSVRFTRREMDLLLYLAANSTRPVPREELLHKVWGYAQTLHIETRTVDIHIAKLRRKIEADPSSPQFLVTVRGAGYRLLCLANND